MAAQPIIYWKILAAIRYYSTSYCKIQTRTISETTYSVHHWHLDDKGKQVIYKGIQGLVGEHPPGKMSYWLHFVVDEELRCHGDETCRKHEAGTVQNMDMEFSNSEKSNSDVWNYIKLNALFLGSSRISFHAWMPKMHIIFHVFYVITELFF